MHGVGTSDGAGADLAETNAAYLSGFDVFGYSFDSHLDGDFGICPSRLPSVDESFAL